MFLFPVVSLVAIPWDFVLILAVLGVVIPWRGVVRVRRLPSTLDFRSADRLALYGTTIGFQWVLIAFVAWRALARGLGPAELAITTSLPLRTALWTAAITLGLCGSQFASLSRVVRLPPEGRGALFHITEKIMPRTSVEIFVYAALSCTAGLSEEFLYRGFAFAVFARLFANLDSPVWAAAIASSAWFAVAHLYQGRRGIITTFIVGMVFAVARIFSASLIPSIIAHAAVDLIAGMYISNYMGKVRANV